MMHVWRLSVVYIGPKYRIERPRKTKIGTEVAHVTCDLDTTFKVKRSKVNLQGAGAYCGGILNSLLPFVYTHCMAIYLYIPPYLLANYYFSLFGIHLQTFNFHNKFPFWSLLTKTLLSLGHQKQLTCIQHLPRQTCPLWLTTSMTITNSTGLNADHWYSLIFSSHPKPRCLGLSRAPNAIHTQFLNPKAMEGRRKRSTGNKFQHVENAGFENGKQIDIFSAA